MTKREFKKQVRSSLRECTAVLDRRMEVLLRSGTVDLKAADLTTCKAAIRAFLLAEADQFILFRGGRVSLRKYNDMVRCMRANM